MKNKIVAQKNITDKVSIRKFLLFSFFMYPFWIITIVNHEKLADFVYGNLFASIMIFIIFAVINYLYGQVNIKYYQAALVGVSTIIFISIFANYTQKNADINMGYSFHLMETFMLYIFYFPVILFIQFFTWIPFLVKFIWQNRQNTQKLKWD